jgi:hypothetical protein
MVLYVPPSPRSDTRSCTWFGGFSKGQQPEAGISRDLMHTHLYSNCVFAGRSVDFSYVKSSNVKRALGSTTLKAPLKWECDAQTSDPVVSQANAIRP